MKIKRNDLLSLSSRATRDEMLLDRIIVLKDNTAIDAALLLYYTEETEFDIYGSIEGVPVERAYSVWNLESMNLTKPELLKFLNTATDRGWMYERLEEVYITVLDDSGKVIRDFFSIPLYAQDSQFIVSGHIKTKNEIVTVQRAYAELLPADPVKCFLAGLSDNDLRMACLEYTENQKTGVDPTSVIPYLYAQLKAVVPASEYRLELLFDLLAKEAWVRF